MQTVQTTLITTATFSDDNKKRYLLRKEWDSKRPKLAVIMLAPSAASGIELDSTTQLVLNNANRLGYGRVDILNLFTTLNDFDLKEAESEDRKNIKVIVKSAEEADEIVYAAGVGKAKNKMFQARQKQVLEALRTFENKLFCLTNESGKARLQHPLSPAVRVWHMSPLKVSELISEPSAIKERRETTQEMAEVTKKGTSKKKASPP